MPTATYSADHIRVEFSVIEYGEEIDPADITVDALVICGVAVPWSGLYPPLQRAIMDLADGVTFRDGMGREV